MAAENQMLRMGEESQAHYKVLNAEVFGGKLSNKTIFFLAMSMGAKQGINIESFKRSNTGPRTELNEDDFALISAIQYGLDGGVDGVLDSARRNLLAEQLAEGGIRNFQLWLDQSNLGDPKLAFIAMVREAMAQEGN